jgi:hypothetical protein
LRIFAVNGDRRRITQQKVLAMVTFNNAQTLTRPIQKPVWVTPNEAVRLSGIRRTMLFELIAAGTLKSIKIQGKRLISFASIEELGSFHLR